MEFTLRVWRQSGPKSKGELKTYRAHNISPDMSLIEVLDLVNAELEAKGEEPIAYYADCLEGICGSCSMMVNGVAHGPGRGCTTCQVYMRTFVDGETIILEPWRVSAFPVIKDLITDRESFDRIIQAGGFVSVNTGSAPDGNAIPIPQHEAEIAMDAAQCIGCGACAASCKNGSAMLFVAAKVSHLAHLPQGQAERSRRVLAMVEQMDKEGFGNCTNQYECEAVCPKEISVKFISELNKEYFKASFGLGK
jgi:succinate dehydrogenase / fumarate reductase, iron-sulfur subunit